MKVQLITSESFVKAVTSISDNIAGKYLLPSITEAQEIHLKAILGDILLAKLKYLIANNGFRGDFGPAEDADYNTDYSTTKGGPNEHYRTLITKCQYYLAYKSVAELTAKVTYKVTNFGVGKSNDENIQTATYDEMVKMRDYYISKADFFCIEVQNYLLNNRTLFPELTEGDIHRIHSCLYSAASCGLWLGGPRGRK